ncbi:MAG: GDSL-type esterase/lipase family protein, partial [Chthoniobacterales bacterium]
MSTQDTDSDNLVYDSSMKALSLSKALQAMYLLTFMGTAGAEDQIRIACVGDSITFGAGCRDPLQDGYPSVLQRSLGDAYKVGNFGIAGANLIKTGDQPYWKEKAFEAAISFEPNAVIILLGTNDTKPQNLCFINRFEQDLGEMIDRFATLPSHPKIWVCLPAPVYYVAWDINQPGLDQLLPIIKRVAAEKKVPVINLFRALSNKPMSFPDGVHPNESGSQTIANT